MLPLVALTLLAWSPSDAAPSSHPAVSSSRMAPRDLDALPDGLRATFSSRGVTVERDDAGSTHRVDVRTRAIGRGARVRELEEAPVVAHGDRHVRELAGVTEWYRPCEKGLEHGWTLHERPEGDSAQPVWIFLAFSGDLIPRIAEDGRGAWLGDREAQLRLRYDGLEAWDASGAPVDARLATCPEGVGVRIVDAGARYPITIDPVFSSPPLIVDGTQSGRFGSAVTTAGDVNGDGYSDVLIAEDFYTGPRAHEGRVLLYLGSASGMQTTPSWSVEGNQASADMGHCASPAGDVNNDGFDDVLVAAPLYDEPGGADHGRVWLYLGSATGLSIAPVWTWTTNQPGANTGWSCATAGDVNHDAYDDIVVGAWLQDSNPPTLVDNGAAYVFFGNASGVSATPDWSSFGAASNVQFGSSVSTAGDADADGFGDIAVGAPLDGATDRGRVHVYRGSATGPITPAIEICPPSVGDSSRFGHSVATAGDLDGDGYADLVVGAPWADEGATDAGKVYVFRGRSTANGTISIAEAWSMNGSQTSGNLGWCVAPAGDVDGDGFADLVCNENGVLPANTSSAYVVLGRPAAPFSTELVVSGTSSELVGSSACAAGDVNGDGFGDTLIGAPGHNAGQGRVRLYYGQPDPRSTVFERQFDAASPGADAGRAVAMGDVDGDAYADLLVGEPGYTNSQPGQGLVRLYRGSPAGISASASWSFEGTSPQMSLGCSIACLNDVDGDGFGDVLVGARGASNGQAGEGHVLLFRGSATGLALVPQVFESNEASAELGFSVAAAGDVNGDGLADAVAGAPGVHLGSPSAGALYLLLGRRSPPGLVAAAGFPISPGIAGSRYGQAVAGAGDLDADGRSDVAVGAPMFTNGQVNEGAVFLYKGQPSGLFATPNIVLESQLASAQFGFAVSTAGDLNGDSFADLLVGAPRWGSTTHGGFAFVYRGQSGSTLVNMMTLHAIHLGQPGADTGHALDYAGDLNGDNFADVVIGAPLWDAASSDGGRVAVFYGAGAGLTGASTLPASIAGVSSPGADFVPGSGANNAQAGSAVAGGADVHADGFGDLIAGAPGGGTGGGGQSFLFGGGGGSTASRPAPQMRRAGDAQVIEVLGNTEAPTTFGINHSLSQYFPSGPSAGLHAGTTAGREAVRVWWEVELLGTPFDGLGLEHTLWADTGSNAPPSGVVWAPVTVPVAGASYHWRMQFRPRNPYFPHSRWFSLQGTSLQEKKIGTPPDCDGDGQSDEAEIAGGAADCDGDAIPDTCEMPPPWGTCATCVDCNANGVLDACDVLVGGMPDSNGDLVPDTCQSGLVTAFCSGDGTANSCPCGNTGASGHGCPSSVFPQGAVLGSSGIARVAFDNLVLLGSAMPNSSALYYQGINQQSGGQGTLFGDGLRCAGGSVIRLGTKSNSGNASQYPSAGDADISVRGAVPAAGGMRTYQVWYRNAATFCTPSTFNLTNGLSVQWIP